MTLERARGLTLIEVMIALSILAFMAAAIYTIMRNATDMQEEERARADLHTMGRNAMERMRKEIASAYLSTYESEHWKTEFKATDRDPIDEIDFVSRTHEKHYPDVRESDLAEVGYRSEEGQEGMAFRTLLHREAAVIDDRTDRGGVTLPMCHNVRELNLRFYDETKEEWKDEWDTKGADTPGRLPRAVEIRLELEDEAGRTAAFVTRTLLDRLAK
jgi:general secretion pathway protein J